MLVMQGSGRTSDAMVVGGAVQPGRAKAKPWVLVLAPPSGDPCRRVGGVPLALRLVLDAQNGGAAGVVAPPESGALACLADPRVRIPVARDMERFTPPGEAPPPSVVAPANLLVHRGLFAAMASEDALSGRNRRDLRTESFTQVAPYGFPAREVTDAETARLAERALFRSLRKPQDGWTSRWLNRYLSLAVSRWLARTPLRPNQLSVVILGMGLWGAWLAAQGTWGMQVLGALLFQGQSVFDGCDGELSRVTYRGSKLGEWVDTVGDDLTNYAFFACAAYGLSTHASLDPSTSGLALYYLVVGVLGIGSGLVASGLEYRYLLRIGSGDLLRYPLSQATEGTEGGWTAAIQPLFKRDTFVLMTLVAALLDGLGVMLTLFALGAVIVLLNVIRTELRLRREGSSPSR